MSFVLKIFNQVEGVKPPPSSSVVVEEQVMNNNNIIEMLQVGSSRVWKGL